jgi:hypothetical protein
MDYRVLMLADPNEIKRILDEFGGRSNDYKKNQPGWASKLTARLAGIFEHSTAHSLETPPDHMTIENPSRNY